MKQLTIRTIRQPADIELTERKSRFIAACQLLENKAQAETFILSRKRLFPDASHHCYAWTVLTPVLTERFSDDREPQGTAGKPILNVLNQQAVNNCGIVVTRYFGGTLLGTGGLSRAYGQAAALVLEKAGLVDLNYCQRFLVEIDYAAFDRLNQSWSEQGWLGEAPLFTATVSVVVAVPVKDRDLFIQLTQSLTSGAARITGKDYCYRALPADRL